MQNVQRRRQKVEVEFRSGSRSDLPITMKLSKKAMEYPLPNPPRSSVPNEETPAWTEIKGGRGGNGNRLSPEVPK